MSAVFPITCIGRRTIPLGPFVGRKGVLIFMSSFDDPWVQALQVEQVADVVHDVLLSQDLMGAVYVVIVSDAAQQQLAGLLAVGLMSLAPVISAWVAPVQPVRPRLELDLGPRWSVPK